MNRTGALVNDDVRKKLYPLVVSTPAPRPRARHDHQEEFGFRMPRELRITSLGFIFRVQTRLRYVRRIKCDAADETNFYSSKQFNFCCLLRVIEILRPRVRAVEMEIHLTEKRPTSSQTSSFERPWNFTCSSLTLPCGHRTKDGGRFASALAPGLQSQLV